MRSTIADDHDAAALGDQVEIPDEIDVREHLDDEIDAAATCLRDDILLISRRGVIEHLVRALLARQRPAALGSCGAEDAQSGCARDLRRGDANGSACAVNQDRLARCCPALVEERAPRGDIRNADTRAFGKRDVARQVMHLIDGANGLLRVRTMRAAFDSAADVHAVAGLELGHVAAHGRDQAGGVGAGGIRQRRQRRVLPAANIGIHRVDAGGFDIDQDLSRAGLRLRHVFQLHDRRIAELDVRESLS